MICDIQTGVELIYELNFDSIAVRYVRSVKRGLIRVLLRKQIGLSGHELEKMLQVFHRCAVDSARKCSKLVKLSFSHCFPSVWINTASPTVHVY